MTHPTTPGCQQGAARSAAAAAAAIETPASAPAPLHGPWGQHLVGASAASAQPPRPSAPGLSAAEAQRVERYHERLLSALRAQDRRALQTAKQAVLRSAYREPATAALRRALRDLSWCMAGMLLPR